MKIVFLCGSLECGRDGVGDYTRRLSGELIRQGHQAAIVALHDQHIANEFSGTQNSEGVELPVLRLPSGRLAKQRFQQAKNWIDNFNPDWLSLQYVPFSFHAKGLPFGLSKLLAALGQGRRWHIMFHELWVGMEIGASSKHFLLGLLQQKLIKQLISNVKPAVIHTQTNIYQAQLAKLGINSLYLPLFTNIPKITKEIERTANSLNEIKEVFSFVIFGSISADSPVQDFVKEVALLAEEKKAKAKIVFIGRCGIELEHWMAACKSEGIQVEVLGEQTAKKISEVLTRAWIGISTTPMALAEKSGTIAAMREHGLPIICVSKPWQAKKLNKLESPPGIYQYQKGNLTFCIADKPNSITDYKVSEVSKRLVERLVINP